MQWAEHAASSSCSGWHRAATSGRPVCMGLSRINAAACTQIQAVKRKDRLCHAVKRLQDMGGVPSSACQRS